MTSSTPEFIPLLQEIEQLKQAVSLALDAVEETCVCLQIINENQQQALVNIRTLLLILAECVESNIKSNDQPRSTDQVPVSEDT